MCKTRIVVLAKLFAVLISLFIMFQSCGIFAYAMNNDYLSREKWFSNSNVQIESINVSSLGSTVNGELRYYADENMCIYTYIALNGSTNYNSDTVEISYKFKLLNEEYEFSVDKNGLSESHGGAEQQFNVSSNFSYSNSGVFISAAEYLGKENVCFVDISVNANKNFPIKNGVQLFRPETTKAQTSAKVKTTKSKSSKTTRTSNSSKLSAKSTTKFVPKHNTTKNALTKYAPTGQNVESNTIIKSSEAVTEETTEELIVESFQKDGSKPIKMTKNSKLLLFIGIAVAVAGIILIVISSFSKDSEADDDNTEDED